jgi:chromate reductase
VVQDTDVAVLIGSLRKASINRMVANALIELETQYCLGQLSIYNQDVDENAPPQWIQFRGRIKAASAVLFVTSPRRSRTRWMVARAPME